MQIVNELPKYRGVVLEKLRYLLHGPHLEVVKDHVYLRNGVHCNNMEHDSYCCVQNIGVSLVASTMEILNAKHKIFAFGECHFM